MGGAVKLENGQWKVVLFLDDDDYKIMANPVSITIHNNKNNKKIIIKNKQDIKMLNSEFKKYYFELADYISEPKAGEEETWIYVEYHCLNSQGKPWKPVLWIDKNGMVSYVYSLSGIKGYVMKKYSKAVFALCKKYGLEVNKKAN
jgi:hypothetical protein